MPLDSAVLNGKQAEESRPPKPRRSPRAATSRDGFPSAEREDRTELLDRVGDRLLVHSGIDDFDLRRRSSSARVVLRTSRICPRTEPLAFRRVPSYLSSFFRIKSRTRMNRKLMRAGSVVS